MAGKVFFLFFLVVKYEINQGVCIYLGLNRIIHGISYSLNTSFTTAIVIVTKKCSFGFDRLNVHFEVVCCCMSLAGTAGSASYHKSVPKHHSTRSAYVFHQHFFKFVFLLEKEIALNRRLTQHNHNSQIKLMSRATSGVL